MSNKFQTDVVIVGAGPVGMFSVFQCGMLGFKCHVVDSLDVLGGQCTALYPEKPIYDIPAFPSVLGADLISHLEEQAKPFNPVYHLGQQVIGLSGKAGDFTLTTSRDATITCKAIIIAAGAGAFGPHRPPLEGIENFEGKSVLYAVRQKELFKNKRIVIAGGGDSAVDWANTLAEAADHITLIHRRDKFRAAPSSLDRLATYQQQGRITILTPYQLDGLGGDHGYLKSVTVSSLGGDKKIIQADYLLPFFGLSTSLGPIGDWGLSLDNNHIGTNQATAETSVPGIYAVGDIAHYPHKLKLILTGFADVAQAAHSIYRQLKPDIPLHFEYSTTKGIKTL
jgi:thioredoxin reductase (NADPH)